MKNILFISIILIALMVSSCNGTDSETKGFDEIELFKIDLNHHTELLSYIPYIQNVKTDRGKLALRGKVKSMEYSVHGTNYLFSFGADGKLTDKTQIEYDKKGKIKEAEYDSSGLCYQREAYS
jgi:hypothetical protein